MIAWALRYTFFSVNKAWGDDPEAFFMKDFLKTGDLTVDLTEVTQLTGASVRLLLVAAGRASRNGSTLAFLAPAGSVAADVLRLSGIAVEPAGTPPPDPEPAAPPDRPPLTPS